MTLLTLLAPATAAPITGEHGGVAAFEHYRVAAGVTFVAGTDAWATAELVLPGGAPLRPVMVGEGVTVFAPLPAVITAAQGGTFGNAARGGTHRTVAAPQPSARAGQNATLTALAAAGGGVNAVPRSLPPARTGASAPTTGPQPARGGLGGS